MFNKFMAFAKEHAVLLTIAVILLILVTLFHSIIQPFIIALIVVYLIDPLVTRMNRVHIKKFHIPRGFAVLVAYLVFLAAVTGVCFAFIPSLTSEISTASEALPKYFMHLKNEDIPRWSEKIDDLMFKLSRRDSKDIARAVNESYNEIDKAFRIAQKEIERLSKNDVDTSGEQPLLIAGERNKSASHDNKNVAKAETPVLFKIRQTQKGIYEILPGDQEIRLESDKEGTLTLKHTKNDDAKTAQTTFNLEREIDNAVSTFLESSTKYAGSALSFIQDAIAFVINTFVQLILVFMLAAFISIDTPRLLKYTRSLFENAEGEAKTFDDFKARLSRGLAGVVRGQLIICCINGTLTGIGLWLFGVEFSLLLGLIAGILSIVPIFGTIISTIPAVLLGLVQGPLTALLVLAWILFVHFIDTNFFTPKIVGSSANLHPVIIIFALLAGQFAAGVLGLILAVPTASILQTCITFILEKTQKARSESEAQAIALRTSAMFQAVTPQGNVMAPGPAQNTVMQKNAEQNLKFSTNTEQNTNKNNILKQNKNNSDNTNEDTAPKEKNITNADENKNIDAPIAHDNTQPL